MSDFITMASTFYEKVDCRMVQLELEFHEASKKQLSELAAYCVLETSRLLSDFCYCQWKFNGRLSSFLTVLEKTSTCSRDFDFSFNADIYSTIVYDSKTFRAYDRLILEQSMGKWQDFSISSDYSEYIRECFSNIRTLEQCKNAILQIMDAPGKKKNALWRQHDISGSFISHSYINNNSMFRGSYNLRIALKCLGDHVTNFSDNLVEMLLKSTSIFPNISARISLSPISSPAAVSPHMIYFGGHVREEKSHMEIGVLGIEWYPYFYFCGAEWFNLLSPIQASHLTGFHNKRVHYDRINSAVYPNGTTCVQLKKPIDQVDVEDLIDMRKLLYDALYPGSSKISLKNLLNPNAFGFLAKPRQEWECIPIFADEIEVNDQFITFQHQHNAYK